MEPPELVIGAQFLLYERGYSDGLFYAPERPMFISFAIIETYNAMTNAWPVHVSTLSLWGSR